MEDVNDRRKKRLKLTPTSRKLMSELEPIRRAANTAFLSQFSNEEKELFLNFIERCSTYAKDQLENPEILSEMYARIAEYRD